MDGSVRVVGLRECGEAMDLLPRDVDRKYIRTALRKGAVVIEKEVEARAPRASGDLASKITVKMQRVRAGLLALVGVRFMGIRAATSRKSGHAPSSEDPAVYTQFLEFGRPGKGGHTHQAAQPFIGPAFAAKGDEAIAAVAETLKTELGSLLQR